MNARLFFKVDCEIFFWMFDGEIFFTYGVFVQIFLIKLILFITRAEFCILFSVVAKTTKS